MIEKIKLKFNMIKKHSFYSISPYGSSGGSYSNVIDSSLSTFDAEVC